MILVDLLILLFLIPTRMIRLAGQKNRSRVAWVAAGIGIYVGGRISVGLVYAVLALNGMPKENLRMIRFPLNLISVVVAVACSEIVLRRLRSMPRLNESTVGVYRA